MADTVRVNLSKERLSAESIKSHSIPLGNRGTGGLEDLSAALKLAGWALSDSIALLSVPSCCCYIFTLLCIAFFEMGSKEKVPFEAESGAL
jgi:hypothetical protein